MNRKIFIAGLQFGELTPTTYIANGLWNCTCSCGNTTTANTTALRYGQRKSCGHCHPTPQHKAHKDRRCAHCGQVIGPDEQYCREWDGRIFHRDCECIYMMAQI